MAAPRVDIGGWLIFGLAADRPDFDEVLQDSVYFATDTGVVSTSDGVSAWTTKLTITVGGYAPGGTDVAVADGGTGASTAPAAATNLGLGTGDSPQFTAVNIGHATDTTLARASAGNLTVEGNALYRAGGTDVPIADGGTGASTKAAAFDALSPMTTAGDIIIGGAAGTGTRLAAGSTSGHVLTSNGSGVAPSYQAAGAGGAGTLTTIKDEGSNLSTAVVSVDFVGAGVTATGTTAVTVTIPGASSTPTGARYPVQEKAGTAASQNSMATTLGSTPTNGNLLIAVVAHEGTGNVTSITQTNVTWTKVAESTATTSPHCEIWKGVVGASASTSVTVAWSATSTCGAHFSEWSGVTGTLDQSAVVTTQSRQYIPTITPTVATALVISAGAQSTFTAGYGAFAGPVMLTFATSTGSNAYAAAFGFPGTDAVIGAWPNSHGGTFSGVTVSLT